ncbi:MAG: DUF4124 domain-containing protein [Gammaproteobacteria bacterium]|jgi:preprotein translocase subunit SecF|nr:DUF4124 domain-containing protein [Gammaproteobacteria bacterium]
MNMRIPLLISAALLLCAMGMAASADQVYRWVDKDGHVHYSQTPPSSTDVNAQTVNINPPAPDPTTLQNEQNLAQQLQDKDKQDQKTQEQAAKAAQAQQQKKQICDVLQQRLAVLQQSGRVATVDAQGNKTYVSDDDRAKQEQQMQDQIAKSCGGGNT